MTFKQACLSGLAALAFVISADGASAHSHAVAEAGGEMAALAEDANLVIRGKVAKVEYKNLEVDGGASSVPFTYVTYKIDDVYRGLAPSDTFTMRFAGGADGKGSFVFASESPRFNVGEEDILFVKGNGADGCPLVNCARGRFRLHQDRVFNADGFPVLDVAGETVTARGDAPEALRKIDYPTPTFDAILTNPRIRAALEKTGKSMDELRALYETQAPAMQTITIVSGGNKMADGGKPNPTLRGRLSEDATGDARALSDDAAPEAMAARAFEASVEGAVAGAETRPTLITSIAPEAARPLPAMEAAMPAVADPGALQARDLEEQEEIRLETFGAPQRRPEQP